MHRIVRHFIALLVLAFICKVAIQAQDHTEKNAVPKSLLLSSLDPEQPLQAIDSSPMVAAFPKR